MELLKLKEILNDSGVIFSFSGTVSQKILTSIAEAIEAEMGAIEEMENKTIRSIFIIFVELMQNIMSYSKDRKNPIGSVYESLGIGLIGYSNEKSKYYVASANNIFPEKEEKIKQKIDKINRLDQAGVKQLYKELRRSGLHKHDRGAGLGFLEIAKKSSEQLEYKITRLTDEQSFFEIKVYV